MLLGVASGLLIAPAVMSGRPLDWALHLLCPCIGAIIGGVVWKADRWLGRPPNS